MRLLTKQLPDNHNQFYFGDKHTGSMLSWQKGWNKLVNLMHSRYDGCINNYGVETGDAIEAIMIDDKRFFPEKPADKDEAVIPSALKQMDAAVEEREPIKASLLCILDGNHPRQLWRYGNITAKICDRLGVDYGTYTAKIAITDSSGGLMYKAYAAHGSKQITSTADDPIRKEANEQLILKRHLKRKASDCAVMVKGHTHKLIVARPRQELYLTDDSNKIKQNYTGWGQNEEYIHPDARWYGNTGSFLRLYGENMSGYAEIAEYDPVELGFLILKVRKRKIVQLEPYYLKI